jgi:hypothetical protein
MGQKKKPGSTNDAGGDNQLAGAHKQNGRSIAGILAVTPLRA